MDNRDITKIVRDHGPRLLQQALNGLVSEFMVELDQKADNKPKKPSLAKRMANFALLRVATRSVPGAIVIGGGLLAKVLYDQRKVTQLADAGKLRK